MNLSAKIFLRCFLFSSLVLMMLLLWVGIAPVQAQCGEPQPSSCTTCHAREDPVNEKGEWHSIHASKDICIKCHGGNGTTMNKDLAHENLMKNPLNDIYTDCHSCHPDDYEARSVIFASTLGVTPGNCVTPTPVPASNISGEPPSGGIYMPNELVSTSSLSQPVLIIGVMLSVLILFLFALSWLDHHHLKS
jgi:hypothetical protein